MEQDSEPMKPRQWQLNEVKVEISPQQKQIERNKRITDYINEQVRIAAGQYIVHPGEHLTLRVDIRLD